MLLPLLQDAQLFMGPTTDDRAIPIAGLHYDMYRKLMTVIINWNLYFSIGSRYQSLFSSTYTTSFFNSTTMLLLQFTTTLLLQNCSRLLQLSLLTAGFSLSGVFVYRLVVGLLTFVFFTGFVHKRSAICANIVLRDLRSTLLRLAF